MLSSPRIIILTDESTTTSNKSGLIVYIHIPFQNLFQIDQAGSWKRRGNLQHSAKVSQRAGNLCSDLLRMGVTTLMRKRTNPDLMMTHCMNNKLELAIHDVVKIQIFIDSLYAFFSQSPNHMREIGAIATELGVHARRVGKAFDICWPSSLCTSVATLRESYSALVKLFQNLSGNNTWSTKEKAKCAGIHAKITHWLLVWEVASVKGVQGTLKALSLFLQRKDATAITAERS